MFAAHSDFVVSLWPVPTYLVWRASRSRAVRSLSAIAGGCVAVDVGWVRERLVGVESGWFERCVDLRSDTLAL